MKKILSIALILGLFGMSVMAQSKTSYFMDGYNYKHDLNPALSPYRGYFNLMGHYAIGINSNLSATQFLYPSSTSDELYTFLHPEVSANQFLNSLNDNNILSLDTDIDVLGFGFYIGRGFFSFDTKLQVDFCTNLPKEFFSFLKQGMNGSNTVYDIRNFNISSKVYASAGIGYAYDIFDNLRVGVKAKYLVAAAGLDANIDQMQIKMSDQGWAINTQATLTAQGYGLETVYGNDTEDQNTPDYITGIEFDPEQLKPAGSGFAFDFGINYSPIKNLNISAALTNVGSIKWEQGSVTKAQSAGEVSYGGFELDVNEGVSEESINNLTEELTNGMMNMIQFREVPVSGSGNTQRLDSRFLIGAEYSTWNNGLSAGMLYTCDNTAYGRFNEVLASINLRPFKALQLSGSYTLYSDYGSSFGASLSLLNILYLSWDHILTNFSPQFVPLDVLSTQVEIGLRLPLGKYRKRDLDKLLYFGK